MARRCLDCGRQRPRAQLHSHPDRVGPNPGFGVEEELYCHEGCDIPPADRGLYVLGHEPAAPDLGKQLVSAELIAVSVLALRRLPLGSCYVETGRVRVLAATYAALDETEGRVAIVRPMGYRVTRPIRLKVTTGRRAYLPADDYDRVRQAAAATPGAAPSPIPDASPAPRVASTLAQKRAVLEAALARRARR